MTAYYNENDCYAADWIGNLSRLGHITPGTIDSRDIHDVSSDDVRRYRRAHFFAGIGGWDLALQLAGWPVDRPVWTGSCPCPPFSSAGKKQRCPACSGRPIPCPRRTGYFICLECGHAWFADGRHLWPEMWRLIRDCRPTTVIGEQVSSPDGRIWLAGVRASLEKIGYAVGAVDLAAASIGSPHIRQRIFWVALDINGLGHPASQRWDACCDDSAPSQRDTVSPGVGSSPDGLGNTDCQRCREGGNDKRSACVSCEAGQQCDGGLADSPGKRFNGRSDFIGSGRQEAQWGEEVGNARNDGGPGSTVNGGLGDTDRERESTIGQISPRPGAKRPRDHDAWSDFDLAPCRDGKTRRIESGLLPLAHGVPNRVGRLRGYGNAIVPQVAAEFIRAFMDHSSTV